MRLPSHALHGQAPRAAAHAQAAASGGARADAAAQLRVWDAAGAAAAVAPPRLLAWRLLAGDADAAARPLGLDWRRALGVHLWRAPPPAGAPCPALELPQRPSAAQRWSMNRPLAGPCCRKQIIFTCSCAGAGTRRARRPRTRLKS
jgi:hypothetical protein